MPRHHMGDVRKGVMVTSAMAMTAVLASAGAASAGVPTAESTTERVLQSVNVTMGPDGTTTAVDSSVVRTDGTAEDAEASDDAFSPSDVVGDLPVRVLTSWRTSEGAGTDLSDLQGYTGRVAIDLTIQNLTVKPEILTYDAAGTSRQQAALVGSPLTVVASTALGDVKADRLVSDDKGTGVNVTNGVIGKGADGTTVQWAALLAPPTLSATSEFSLVLDAKDFDVPSFDLSVQPGLVTDPSMGALVDAAFNPASSDELDLQRRTIELIGEVNGVLARASDTIGDVRTSLTSSAETLGTQTVADLRSSTQSVTTNMSSLGSALQGLQGDLNSTLESTGSSAVAELEQALNAVDQMLGDTSAGVPRARVDANGCRTVVANPKGSQTVYGNLLQVASQLDGYAEATSFCRTQLRETVVATIGAEDSIEDCLAAEGRLSATCALLGAEDSFVDIAESLTGMAEKAIELLDPELYAQALGASGRLGTAVDALESITGLLDSGRLVTVGELKDVKRLVAADDPDTPPNEAGDLVEEIASVRADLDEINTDARDLSARLDLAGMQTQADDAATSIASLCAAVLTDEQRTALDGALVSLRGSGCDDQPVETDSLVDRLNADDYPELDSIIESSDTAAGAAGAASALREIEEIRAEIDESVQNALDLKRGNPPRTLDDLTADLGTAFDSLQTARDELNLAVGKLQEKQAEVPDIREDIGDLVESETDNVNDELAGSLGQLKASGQNADTQLGEMFDESASGLRGASDAIVSDSRKALRQQKQGFFAAQQQAANRVTQTVKDGLGQINSGVNASTRDMEAATTLLVADLRKVLLDLGQREIGGAGLLGSMATNAATARQADYQLALAGSTASAYANVRDRDIAGLMLRQEQTDAAMDSLTRLPAFQLELPSGSQHRTVYSFSIEDN